jgi:hypothetical protein
MVERSNEILWQERCVGQRAASSNRRCFFAREPGCIFRGLKDVLFFQFGIGGNNLIGVHSITKELQDEIDGNAHSPDRRAAFADFRVNADAIDHVLKLMEAGVICKLVTSSAGNPIAAGYPHQLDGERPRCRLLFHELSHKWR